MAKQAAANADDHDHDHEEGGDDPTIGSLLKWVSVCFTVVMTVVSGVWFVATVKSDASLLKQDVETTKHRVAEVDRQSEKRHDLQEKSITELTRRSDDTEKHVQEMARKLDVAVSLLERIDQKVGKP